MGIPRLEVKARGFNRGLIDILPAHEIPADACSDVLNCLFDEKPNTVVKNPGFQLRGPLPSGLVARDCFNYTTSQGQQTFLASDGATLYSSPDGVTWTSRRTGLNPAFFLEFAVYADFVYCTNGFDDVFKISSTFVVTTLAALPKGKYIAVKDDRLWIARTSGSASGLFFSDIGSPEIYTDNAGATFPGFNPLSVFEVDNNDGQEITAIKPYFSNMFIFKDRSSHLLFGGPLETAYGIQKVHPTLGTIFNRSIQIWNNLLIFLSERGVWTTDGSNFTRISDPIINTFNSIKQTKIRSVRSVFDTQGDFDSGVKSTLVDTAGGTMAAGSFDTAAEWQGANLVSGDSVDVESTPGQVTIQGIPVWTNRYEANEFPQDATPAWDVVAGDAVAATALGGILTVQDRGIGSSRQYSMARHGVFASSKDTWAVCKFQVNANSGMAFFVANGSRISTLILGVGGFGNGTFNGASIFGITAFTYHTAHILLKADNTSKLWIDGVLASAQPPTLSSENKIELDPQIGAGGFVLLDYVYEHNDFKGDMLQSFGGKITPLTLPSTLPSTGNVVVLNDLTRTPDALRRIYQLSVLNGGTIGLESWTSATTDFTSGNDPAGYVATANGAVPTSLTLRAQRLRATLTRADASNGPELQKLFSGSLWRTGTVPIGNKITDWSVFEDEIVVPAGSDLTIKIRLADTAAPPLEADYGPYFTITSGQDIGVVTGNTPPPAFSLWADVKVELGVNSSGEFPYLNDLIMNWFEGGTANSLVVSVIHEERYKVAYTDISVDPGASENNRVLVYDKNGAWTKLGIPVAAFVILDNNLFHSDSVNANFYADGIGLNYNGAAINAFFVTKKFDGELPDIDKLWRTVAMTLSQAPSPSTVSVTVVTEEGGSQVVSVPLAQTPDPFSVIIDLPYMESKRLQLTIGNNVVDQGLFVTGFSAFARPRKALRGVIRA